MTTKLTDEQREAIQRREGQAPVPVRDEQTNKVYFLVDAEAVETLGRQQDLDAIREGLADVEAGRVSPTNEAFARIREKLGLPTD